MATAADADEITCRLQHHGAAAASNRKVLAWIPRPVDASSPSNSSADITETDTDDSADTDNDNQKSMLLVYPSHAMLNIVAPTTVLLANGVKESVWIVCQTLRTEQDTNGKTVITCVSTIKSGTTTTISDGSSSNSNSNAPTFVACGFSDGSISLWRRSSVNSVWTESIVLAAADSVPSACISTKKMQMNNHA